MPTNMKINAPARTQRLKQEPVYINRPSDVFTECGSSLLSARTPNRNRKHFWTISLDGANQIIYAELLSIGSRTYSVVEPVEVFRTPILKGARKVILVSNCPAGNRLYPSSREKAKAMDLIRCGKMLGITMADYVIISDRTYYSFAEIRNLPGYKVEQ